MLPTLFVMAYMLDLTIGDPEWLPHPVRLMGHAIKRGERVARALVKTRPGEFIAGALLTIVIVGATGAGAAWLLALAGKCSRIGACALLVYLASTAMATRSLLDEAQTVGRFLQAGELERARTQVGRIVGRDTDKLDEPEIVRAAVETVAESASDGIVAPMFYLALGGVPAALAYKAINTLDSMIGHNDARYRYFGKFAARLDDVANFVPARLTALLIVMAAFVCGRKGRAAWQIWQRDGAKHASPNAGRPEAAMAGALGVRLGGLNFYDGEPHSGAYLGEARRPLSIEALYDSLIIVALVSVFMFLMVFGWLIYRHGGLL